jgi:hypothetical protein
MTDIYTEDTNYTGEIKPANPPAAPKPQLDPFQELAAKFNNPDEDSVREKKIKKASSELEEMLLNGKDLTFEQIEAANKKFTKAFDKEPKKIDMATEGQSTVKLATEVAPALKVKNDPPPTTQKDPSQITRDKEIERASACVQKITHTPVDRVTFDDIKAASDGLQYAINGASGTEKPKTPSLCEEKPANALAAQIGGTQEVAIQKPLIPPQPKTRTPHPYKYQKDGKDDLSLTQQQQLVRELARDLKDAPAGKDIHIFIEATASATGFKGNIGDEEKNRKNLDHAKTREDKLEAVVNKAVDKMTMARLKEMHLPYDKAHIAEARANIHIEKTPITNLNDKQPTASVSVGYAP